MATTTERLNALESTVTGMASTLDAILAKLTGESPVQAVQAPTPIRANVATPKAGAITFAHNGESFAFTLDASGAALVDAFCKAPKPTTDVSGPAWAAVRMAMSGGSKPSKAHNRAANAYIGAARVAFRKANATPKAPKAAAPVAAAPAVAPRVQRAARKAPTGPSVQERVREKLLNAALDTGMRKGGLKAARSYVAKWVNGQTPAIIDTHRNAVLAVLTQETMDAYIEGINASK